MTLELFAITTAPFIAIALVPARERAFHRLPRVVYVFHTTATRCLYTKVAE